MISDCILPRDNNGNSSLSPSLKDLQIENMCLLTLELENRTTTTLSISMIYHDGKN
jgi:hypothetical protein